MINLPPKLQIWVDARKRHNLSHEHIQMARDLGLNPKKFGSLDNHKQELWKAPLPQFIEKIYFKHFKKDRPDTVKSIEQMYADQLKKKQNKALRKAEKVDKGTCAQLESGNDTNNNLEESMSNKKEVKISFGSSMLDAEDAIAKELNEAKKQLMEEARKKQAEKSNTEQKGAEKV